MSSSLDAKSALLRVGHRRLSSAIGSMRKMSQGMMPTINLQMRETMSDEEWRMLCMVLSIDYTKGLAWTDLIIVYTKLAEQFGADLSKDFEICFPNCELSKR